MAEEKRLKTNVPQGVQETPEDFDPQRAQAERLPQSRWGGGDPAELVKPVTSADEEQAEDEEGELGYRPVDPSTFTGE